MSSDNTIVVRLIWYYYTVFCDNGEKHAKCCLDLLEEREKLMKQKIEMKLILQPGQDKTPVSLFLDTDIEIEDIVFIMRVNWTENRCFRAHAFQLPHQFACARHFLLSIWYLLAFTVWHCQSYHCIPEEFWNVSLYGFGTDELIEKRLNESRKVRLKTLVFLGR